MKFRNAPTPAATTCRPTQRESSHRNQIPTEQNHSYVRWDPLGIVLAVMPWNFPFWQVFRFLTPALMAGNVALAQTRIKNIPQCALAIESPVRRAGSSQQIPDTPARSSLRSNTILADERIAAVTVTGSEVAGRAIGAEAGWLIKKSVLELGGGSFHRDAVSRSPPRRRNLRPRPLRQQRTICIAGKRFLVADESTTP